MTHQKTKKLSRKLVQFLPIVILALAIIQTTQITIAATATSNPWAIKLLLLNDQNVNASVFQPFDFIHLCADVTYNDASQPDVLVSFNIVGPSTSPINIARIETTNATGMAEFSFRLPVEAENEDSIIGKWNVTATVTGAQPQSSSFITRWGLETAAISLLNSQGKNQTVYSPGNNVAVEATIQNLGQAQTANVTFNMQESGQIINQTEVLNSQIGSTNQTQVQTTIQIPNNASAGQAAIIVALYEGAYNGTDIPAAENQTVYFTIAGSNTTTTTPTPTPTATVTPTPPPTVLQNSVSLFSWLLVATGFFTFTLLYAFLRRKPILTSPSPQMPNMPGVKATPSTMPPADSTKQQPTAKQSTAAAPTAMVAPEKVIQATMMGQVPPIYETWQSQTSSNPDEPDKPDGKSPGPQELSQAIATHLGKISETGKKVQVLETALKVEREHLTKEVGDLNNILEEQERAIKSYFDSIRQAVAAINSQPAEDNDKQNSQPKDLNDNPPPAKEYSKQNTQQTEPSNATPNSTINTQPIGFNNIQNSTPAEVNNKPNPPQTENSNKQNPQPTQQNFEDKNVKPPESKIRRQQRTQEEDIKIAEHNRED